MRIRARIKTIRKATGGRIRPLVIAAKNFAGRGKRLAAAYLARARKTLLRLLPPRLKRFAQKRPSLIPWLKAGAVLFFAVLGIAAISNHQRDIVLKQRIGQMLMVGFRGTDAPADSYIAKTISGLDLAGVILFDYDVPSKSRPRNITDPAQTKKLIAELKSYAVGEPLLVAVDAEGGYVNRLKTASGFIPVPSAKQIGQSNDIGAALAVYWNLARQLSELGFNANFAPVVDVDVNPENPVIGGLERSYSADPQKVLANAKAFVASHKSFGIITALKHFPGHGSSAADSHLGLADVTATYTEPELLPYQELIRDKVVDSVMTAHIIDRNIDPDYPATLSSKFIDGILRRQLGFDGVVISDDMQMGAIVENYGFEDALIRAINAGCDILIFSNNGETYDESVPWRARDTIFKAVKDGRISRQRIDQAYERIVKLKKGLGK